jgi:hypothetical protein
MLERLKNHTPYPMSPENSFEKVNRLPKFPFVEKLSYRKGILALFTSLVPDEGFEPTTNGLQNRCSTTELTRQILDPFFQFD